MRIQNTTGALLYGLAGGLRYSISTPTCSAPVAKVQVESGCHTNVALQLVEMLKQKDFFFVNVHIPYEGEIESTDAQIPYDQTAQQLSQYPSDKAAKIVLYCRSGRMSSIAAKELVKAGYTNVWNLDGGMSAWEVQGLPLKGQ
jgi:rhodanese-related sulfurtransferase